MKIKNLKLKIISLFIPCYLLALSAVVGLLVTASPISAQVKIGEDVFKTPIQNFGQLVTVVVSNLYIIAGIVLLFLIIFAGFGILSGAGSGDQQKTAQGKQALTNAIIGFLIIFASYWIIQLIQAITGVKIFNPGL